MRQKCGKKSELCGGYAAKNCTYAVIMRIQNQIVRLCCYGAANWRALKVKRWSRVKIAACKKLLVSCFDLFVGGDVELVADGAERFKKRPINQD